MKIYPDKLAETISRQLGQLYILTGEETLLMNEACDAIRRAARQQGFQEREVFYAETKNTDWSPLLQSLNSMSLFSDKKIIEIRASKANLAADDFLEYWERPNPDCLVIVTTEKIDKKSQSSKWFSTLDKAGIHIEFWPLEGARFNQWLGQRARQCGLNLDSDALHVLAERTEGNLLAAAQELEKLALLFQQENIDAEKLTGSVLDNARYDVFKLVDSALAGDANATLRILNGLREEGTVDSVLLWALARELRALSSISDAMVKGQYSDQLLIKHGIWDKRQTLVKNALKRLSQAKLAKLLQLAHQIDLSIKGLGSKTPKDEIENLCLRLAGTTI